MALEEPDNESTDPKIQIGNNCIDAELHFGMAGGCDDYDHEGNKIDESDHVPSTSWWWRAATELEMFDQGTSDVDVYEGHHGDHAHGDQEEDASQADDGSPQTLEDWGYSTRDCEDWTAYYRPVEYDNGKANATASDVRKAKIVL